MVRDSTVDACVVIPLFSTVRLEDACVSVVRDTRDEVLLFCGATETGRDHEREEKLRGADSDRRGGYFPAGASRTFRDSDSLETERETEEVMGGASIPPVGTTTVSAETPGSRRGATTREDQDI